MAHNNEILMKNHFGTFSVTMWTNTCVQQEVISTKFFSEFIHFRITWESHSSWHTPETKDISNHVLCFLPSFFYKMYFSTSKIETFLVCGSPSYLRTGGHHRSADGCVELQWRWSCLFWLWLRQKLKNNFFCLVFFIRLYFWLWISIWPPSGHIWYYMLCLRRT